MRLDLANDLKTRIGDHTKDARAINAYPDVRNGAAMLRKRAAASATPINIGANAQMLGTLLDAHIGIGFAANGSTTLNESSGVVTANAWQSATKTTQPNCDSITVNVSLLSSRGNGLNQYYYRAIRWRVDYYNGSSWVAGTFRPVLMGAQITSLGTDSVKINFPSPNAWQWYVYAEAYDYDGTTFGSVSYSYSNTTVTAPNVDTGYLNLTYGGNGVAAYSAYSAATGSGEIYQIDYFATPTVYSKVNTGTNALGMNASLATGYTGGTHWKVVVPSYNHVNSSLSLLANGLIGTNITNLTTAAKSWSPGAQGYSVTGSGLAFNQTFWALGTDTQNTSGQTRNDRLLLSGMSAVIYRRTIIAGSSATANTYTVSSYSYTISTGTGAGITDATKTLVSVVGDELNLVNIGILDWTFDALDMSWDDADYAWG